MYLALKSQPPKSIQGKLRLTEQGEMIQAKFGIAPQVATRQMEVYTTGTLLATLEPPSAAKEDKWRSLMDSMAEVSCQAYRGVVYNHPLFLDYFHEATAESELGNLNIGSRPAHRNKDKKSVSSIRAIPWIFSWTQTRFGLPSWLGVGVALHDAIDQGHVEILQEMYNEWPFFQSLLDLVEMVLAKSDLRIAKMYDDILIQNPKLLEFGEELRGKFTETVEALNAITGHTRLAENNKTLRHLITFRNPYIDIVNILQANILKDLRLDPNNKKLRDALLITINGIAAGMRNTG
ncbi:hypothetical protein CYMTET_29190 [Cymbomonas tetramitiformis]|uniref:Phosphoenolpyruvate carboxylase n=1 Tax=Cymbomonas tetramitiformis TaxID=36881 RepID=A0AAE0KV66_9CHLO|nr:hypothetical protein CYMTET_29190 [Cymbomonas tetramitiformis]